MVCIDPVTVVVHCLGELVVFSIPRADLCALAQVAYGSGFEAPRIGRRARRGGDGSHRLGSREPWQS